MLNDVKAFAEKFQCFTNAAPGFLPDDHMKNRLDFQMEELLETAHAAGFYFNSDKMEFRRMHVDAGRNLAEALDGLIDQTYVALGTAVAMGFAPAFPIGWDRVHAANMSKELVPGKWKIQKPAGWKRPFMGDLVK
jgi:predicted HAD superfamily Cof-like phosphohydrolase